MDYTHPQSNSGKTRCGFYLVLVAPVPAISIIGARCAFLIDIAETGLDKPRDDTSAAATSFAPLTRNPL